MNDDDRTIATQDLRPDHLPAADASEYTLSDFAHTYDGYEGAGSFEAAAELSHTLEARFKQTGTVAGTLDELRTALFFWARSLRHGGLPADEASLAFARALVAAMRAKVA